MTERRTGGDAVARTGQEGYALGSPVIHGITRTFEVVG